MNVVEFATVVEAMIRRNVAVAKHGGGTNHYLVPMGWGDPGLGKTEVVEALVEALGDLGRDLGGGADEGEGWQLVYADLATRDPADLGGMPWVVDGRSTRCRPDWLPTRGRGVLFLDELPQAGIATMNVAAMLVREHRVGEHRLPRSWQIVCAGNHLRNRAGTTAMPSHLNGRLVHLEVEPDAHAWARWAAKRGVKPMLIAYNRYRAAEYHHKVSATEKAYPTPRTWAMGDATLDLALPGQLARDCMRGAVGAAAEADYQAFVQVFDGLPDVDAIIRDPEAGPVPRDTMTLYALMGALAHRARPGTLAAVVRYLDRLPEQEFAVACMVDATARDAGLAMTPAYNAWAARHGDLLSAA